MTAPTVLSKVAPEYSEEARRKKVEGTVVLSCVVDSRGHARDIQVAQSLGSGLDEEAVKALQEWKSGPGKKNGVPVSVKVRIEVNFRLIDRK